MPEDTRSSGIRTIVRGGNADPDSRCTLANQLRSAVHDSDNILIVRVEVQSQVVHILFGQLGIYLIAKRRKAGFSRPHRRQNSRWSAYAARFWKRTVCRSSDWHVQTVFRQRPGSAFSAFANDLLSQKEPGLRAYSTAGQTRRVPVFHRIPLSCKELCVSRSRGRAYFTK